MHTDDWGSQDLGARIVLGGEATPNPVLAEAVERDLSARTTLDQLNAELAILDRPLEDDVEYYDDPPPSQRWRRVGAILVGFILLGGVTAVAGTRWSPPPAADQVTPSAPLALAAPPAVMAAPDATAPAVPASRQQHHHHHHRRHHHARR